VRDSRGVLNFEHGAEFGYDDRICQHIDTCIRLETPPIFYSPPCVGKLSLKEHDEQIAK